MKSLPPFRTGINKTINRYISNRSGGDGTTGKKLALGDGDGRGLLFHHETTGERLTHKVLF